MCGSVASFTDHLSNFTKDVLMKRSKKEEESFDSKRKEVEITQITLRSEIDRLKTLSSNLDQKYEISELQKQQTVAYQHEL